MTRRWSSAVAALGLVGAALAGCGGTVTGSAGSITVYNGQHPQTTDALDAGFERATGIHVNVRSNDEDILANQIASEGSRSPADVIFAENSPVLEHLQGEGYLAPVEAATLANTPARYSSPEGDWVGVSARVSVIVYNPSVISQAHLPTTILALADPAYKNKLALAPTETDFQPIVTSVAATYGKARALQWLKGVKSNATNHIYSSSETITQNVNRGLVAFGVINQYYWYRLGSEIGTSNVRSKIAYLAPHDPGYVIDVSGAAVLRSSRHQAEAQRYVAYLTSAAGQEIIAHSSSFEYPIASGVTTAQPETAFSRLQPDSITVADLGDGSAAVGLLKQAGLL